MYTEEELQDTIEYLEKKVDNLENTLDSLLSLLVDEEIFSEPTRNKLWEVYNDFSNI